MPSASSSPAAGAEKADRPPVKVKILKGTFQIEVRNLAMPHPELLYVSFKVPDSALPIFNSLKDGLERALRGSMTRAGSFQLLRVSELAICEPPDDQAMLEDRDEVRKPIAKPKPEDDLKPMTSAERRIANAPKSKR